MKHILAMLVLCLSSNIHAQLATSKFNSPVSPEVATLGKFIDMPVGTYSGVPDISVPLYTVDYKSVSMPLELRYHASGIKVDQDASWVGLGWDMFNGGFITQTIVGDLEEFVDQNFQHPAGFNQFAGRFLTGVYSGAAPIDRVSSWGCGADAGTTPYSQEEYNLIRHYLMRGWGQPDIYTFSFLGRSGKFVLDPVTKEPVVLKKSESFKIERLGTTPQSGWRIKTPDGMEFTFDLRAEGWSQRIISQTWRLSKIKSFDGTVITFEYLSSGTSTRSISESLQSDFFEFQTGPYCPPSGSPDKPSVAVGDFLVTKINTPKEVIEFVLEDRLDPGYKRLKEIVIKDKVSLLPKKAFEFQYDYFEADQSGNTWYSETNGKRLKLLSVREAGYDNQGLRVHNPSYKFEYDDSIPFPQRTSYAVDYWGYYNGQRNNTTMLPDVVPLYVNTPTFLSIPKSILNTPYKANRGPSAVHMQVGMLKKITFPTGGYKVFTFEPHRFNNYTFYDATQMTEFDILESAYDQNATNSATHSKHIGTLPITTIVTFTFGVTTGANSTGELTFSDVVPSYATLRKKFTDGTFSAPIRTWSMPDNIDVRTVFNNNGGSWNISEDITLIPEPGVEYWVTTYLPDVLGPQNQSGKNATASCTYSYYASIVDPGTASYYGSGLRIAKVQLYDESGSLSYVRSYEYTKNGQPTGKLLSPPSFLQSGARTYIKVTQNHYPPIVGCSDYFATTTKQLWTVTSGSNRSLQLSANGGYVGYSYVKVVERSTKMESDVNSIVEYEFMNQDNPVGGGYYPEVPLLSNGLPTKVSYRTKDNILVKKEVFNYFPATNHNRVIHGYTAEDVYYGIDGCATPGDGCGGDWTTGNRYLLRSYPVRSQFWQLTSKTVNDYVASDSIITLTNYTYNTLGQLKTETTTNSRNDIVSKEYKYPIDYNPPTDPFPDTVVSNLNNKYFFPTIEEKQLLNAAVQRKSINSFTYNSPGKYVAKSVNLKNNASTVLDFINYTSYSITGNPKEFKGKNGVSTVVLWGRNGTVPIAKIEGATLAQVNGQVNSTTVETMATASLRTELLKLYNLTNCFVQVYIYDDKGQLIEIIDPSRTSTYFEYDAFGRFSLARDHDRNIIANYQYNYFNSESGNQ
jgi:YD repeat-containing protein